MYVFIEKQEELSLNNYLCYPPLSGPQINVYSVYDAFPCLRWMMDHDGVILCPLQCQKLIFSVSGKYLLPGI